MIDSSVKPFVEGDAPKLTGGQADERLLPVFAGLLALIAASLPYAIGYWGRRHGVYLWAGTSPSDFAVYLAWIHAASLGSLRDPHLFAGGHPGMLINPVYWVMGTVCALTGLSGTLVYHVSRVALGAALLYVLWRFVRMCLPDPLARRLAFLFLCFSSGFGWCLGWLPLHWWSIDRWQPEAFTFLSLYSYPHFCVALILQVAIVGLLMKSIMTGHARYSVGAGLCGLLLAIIHTYDIISIGLVWIVYAFAPATAEGPARSRLARATLVAGAVTLPGLIYIYQAMRTDRVFAQRVAEPTLSYPLYTILIGYGGVLLLAIVGTRLLARKTVASITGSREIDTILPIWAVVNIAASYLPVLFQRKLLQGAHVPLCLLAAIGAAHLLRRYWPARNWRRLTTIEIALTVFLSAGSALYLYLDTRDILAGFEQRRYRSTLLTGEMSAMRWVARNTPRGAVVQAVPWVSTDGEKPSDTTLALFLPGLTGRPEYAGHWAETPDFDARTADLIKFAFPRSSHSWSGADRAAFLRQSRIAYLVFSQKRDPAVDAGFVGNRPAIDGVVVTRAYGNADADVYRVTPER